MTENEKRRFAPAVSFSWKFCDCNIFAGNSAITGQTLILARRPIVTAIDASLTTGCTTCTSVVTEDHGVTRLWCMNTFSSLFIV